MKEVSVRVSLKIDDDDGTWVTVVPAKASYPRRTDGIAMAAGEAVALFVSGIVRDAEVIVDRMAQQ